MSGAAALGIAIAGVGFAVHLPGADWRPVLAERYAAFLAEPGAAAWRVVVRHEPGLGIADAQWIDHDGAVTAYRTYAHAGRFDLARREAEFSTPSPARAGPGLDRALAYICMQALPRMGAGLLLHAAGVVREGMGAAFTGASGAGKTTVAGLAAGRGDVLCDENVVVGLGPRGPELWSTPFWGGSTPAGLVHRVNRRVPLAAIYVLEHAAGFHLARLAPAAAIMALLTTEKVATERPESAAAWLATAARLIAAAPVYRLGFRPTAELWDFLPAAPRP